ncbi:MAG: FxsA family protein [Alphaproteobacteria bacterium]
MPILFLMFIWFIAEIISFIYLGGMLGIGETIVEIIATIIIGMWLIKRSLRSMMSMGLGTITRGATSVIPNIIGGTLLIIPGFLTDFLGVLTLLSVPFSIILLILGFGNKPNVNTFFNSTMGGMGKDNPFKKSNPFEKQSSQGENPFAGNPFFEDMLKKTKSKQEQK